MYRRLNFPVFLLHKVSLWCSLAYTSFVACKIMA
jgi:hypothetical protein